MSGFKTENGILALVDIVDYTGQATRLGDQYAAQYTAYFNEKITDIVSRHRFTVIKSLGDAILFFGKDPADILGIMTELFERDKPQDRFGFRSRFRLVAHSGYFQFQLDNGRPIDLVSPEGIKVFRLEKEARAWELVVTQPLFQGLKSLLAQNNVEANRLLLKEPLKGFDNEEWFPPFYRLRLVPAARGVSNLLGQRQDELCREVQEIPVFGKIYKPVPMEKNFINLSLKPSDKPLDFCPQPAGEKDKTVDKEDRKRRRGTRGWHDHLDADGEHPRADRDPDIDVPTLYKNYCRGLIFGLPGAGKTTILRHLAFLEFKARETGDSEKKRLILFVPCRDIPFFDTWLRKHNRESTPDTVTDDALDYLTWVFLFGTKDYYDISPGALVEFQAAGQKVKQAFAAGRLTLLLDALDEAPDRDSKERIKELFSGLASTAGKENRTFLTSRPSEHFSIQDVSVPIFYVRNLDMEQVRQIARHLVDGGSEVYKAFDTALWQEEVVVKMAATPITALLVTAYFQAYGKFEHRFPMYDLLVKFILLKVWDRIKKDTLPYQNLDYFFEAVKGPDFLDKSPDIAILYQALAALCFDLFYDSVSGQIVRSIPEETLLAYFIDFIGENRHILGSIDPPVLARDWLDQFHADHLLLRAGKSDYVFVHSTVMEYLAAFHLAGLLKDDPDKYGDRVDRALGSIGLLGLETIPLAAGSDLYRGFFILARIRDLKVDYDRQQLMAVGLDCLAEIEWQVTKSFQSIVIEKLRGPMRKIIRDNRPACDWLYAYLKGIMLGPDKEQLRRAIGLFEPTIKLSRETFLEEYLDHESFDKGDAEIIDLRRQWLKNLVQSDLAETWLAGHEQYRLKRENIAVYADVRQLDSVGYHPEDKNFAYYRNLIGPELIGFFGSPNFRHAGRVTSVAVSPAGKHIISGSDDGSVRLWASETGKEIRVFAGHRGSVKSVALSLAGQTIVSGSDDGTVRLWDIANGKQVHAFAGHQGSVLSVAFSPAGQTIVSGSNDGTVRLWDIETGKEIRSFYGHGESVLSVALSPDGKFIVSGSADGTVRLWDIAGGKEIRVFSGHRDSVWSVAVSPDFKYIVSGSDDGTVRLWDRAGGQELQIFYGHKDSVSRVAVSPDGKTIFSWSEDGSVRLWDSTGGEEVRTFSGHRGFFLSVAFSPNGKYIVSGSDDGTVRLWDITGGTEIRAFAGHRDWIRSVAVSPDGQYLVSGSDDSTLRLWDMACGREVRTLTGHQGSVGSVAISPAGQTIVSGSGDGTVRLWDKETGKQVRKLTGHKDSVWNVAFSNDGKHIVSGSADCTLRLWDMETGIEIRTFAKHQYFIRSVAISPVGQYLVSGSNDGTVRLWDIKGGKEIRAFTGHRGDVFSVAFSPDGKHIVSGSADKTLRLWEAFTGKNVRVFTGPKGSVWSVAFSVDGRYVLSGSWDRTVRLWNRDTGDCIHCLNLTWPVNDIKPLVTEPGIYAAACGNGTVVLLDLSRHLT